MTITVANLKADFPVWYREVSIEADDAQRALRLEAISMLAKNADCGLAEGLVRLAFNISRHQPTSTALDRVHDCFREKDPTFDPAASAREIQILAGACLVEMFNSVSHIGNIAALSVATASLGKSRKPELPMDLPALADQAVDQLSVEARVRPDLSEYRKTLALKISDNYEEPAEGEAAEAIDASDLSRLAKEVQSALRTVANRQTRMVGSLEQFIKVQDEELQVLWWFLGGRSNDLDCDFAQIPSAAQPLVLAKELADETYILPGLRTVRPLMARAGLNEKTKMSLPDVINGTPVDWLKQLMDDSSPSPVTQPIHFAVSRRLEVEDEKSWVEAWAGTSGIKATQKFNTLELGELFYREQLLRQSS